MLRGIGEDDWKQFVRTERPFPSSPCGYLGYDQRPHRQRGFSDKPTYNAKPQAQQRGPRQHGGRPQDSNTRRQGQQGEQRRGGQGQGTLTTWVRKDANRRRGGNEGEGAVQLTRGASSPSQC
jgi:hypothetical protein